VFLSSRGLPALAYLGLHGSVPPSVLLAALGCNAVAILVLQWGEDCSFGHKLNL